MEEYDILIIGAGPAGMWAAVYATLNKLHTCIIEISDTPGGQPFTLYSDKEIEDIPGYSVVKAGYYVQTLVKQFKYHKDAYTLYTKTELVNWKKNESGAFECQLSNGKQIVAKFMLFAIGLGEFCPVLLKTDLSDDFNQKIHYRISDVNFFKDKKTLIFGGGDSALDWANTLVQQNVTNDVILIHHSTKFRALPKSVENLKNNNITTFLNYTLETIGNNQVELKHKESNERIILEFEELICMYGAQAKPCKYQIMTGFDLKANKFLTNRNQETSIENIFAIGQACIYDNRPNLIVVAQSEASIAIKTIVNKLKKRN